MLQALFFITTFLMPFYIIRLELFGIPTNVFEIGVLLLLIQLALSFRARSKTSREISICGRLSRLFKRDPSAEPALSLPNGVGMTKGMTSQKIQKIFFVFCILFLVSSILGIVNAGFSTDSLGIFKSWVVVPILLALVIRSQVTGYRKSDSPLKPDTYYLKPLFWGLYTSVLAVSIWAVLQRLGIISTMFYQVGDPSFQQYLGSHFRAFGPFESPNYLAMFIAPASLLSAGLISNLKSQKLVSSRPEGSKVWKWALYLSLVLPPAALILSQSRAGLIAALGALSIVGVIYAYKKLQNKSHKIILSVSSIILYSLFIILVFKFALRPEADAVRFEIYRYAWTMVGENWLTGIGAGKFHEVLTAMPIQGSFLMDSLSYAIHPHNLYMALWLNFGLLGLVSFLGVTIWSIIHLLQKKSTVSYFLLAALLSILLHGVFDTTYFKNDLSVIYWLIIALQFII